MADRLPLIQAEALTREIDLSVDDLVVTAPRITRANLNALATANNLHNGRIYLITDESRIAIAHSSSAYTTYLKESDRTIPNEYRGGTYGLVLPGASTGMSQLGFNATVVGTVGHPQPATTSFLARLRRTTILSGSTAGSFASIRQAVRPFYRGAATNQGGFYFRWRFAIENGATGLRSFWGLSSASANPTNIDPLVDTTLDKLGIGVNTNGGNWFLINNITGTAPTTLDLGTDFAFNTPIELILFCLPNASRINYSIKNLATGVTTSGEFTTNIPANTTFLGPFGWACNNTAANAVTIALILMEFSTPT